MTGAIAFEQTEKKRTQKDERRKATSAISEGVGREEKILGMRSRAHSKES